MINIGITFNRTAGQRGSKPGYFRYGLILAGGLLLVGSLGMLSGCATQAKMQRLKQASAHYKLGVSYLTERKTQDAFVEFQKAVDLDPKHRDSHYALGHIYFVQTKHEDAEREFRRALKIDPDFSEAHNYLGKVYEQWGQWDQAIRQYRAALSNPTYQTPDIARYNLGVALQNKGQTEEALREYEQAVLINPSHISAHYALARLYTDLGDLERATASYQAVLDLFPESAKARYELAWVYLKSGSVANAIREFKILLERAPESDWAGRSKKHLGFLESASRKLQPGMSAEQVMKIFDKQESVVRTVGPSAGEEQWFLNNYEMVLLFQDGRYVGPQERIER